MYFSTQIKHDDNPYSFKTSVENNRYVKGVFKDDNASRRTEGLNLTQANFIFRKFVSLLRL